MGLPEEVLLVVQEHEQERTIETLKTLSDVLFVANRLANVEHGWRDPALGELTDPSLLGQLFDAEALSTLLAESAEDVASLKSALAT